MRKVLIIICTLFLAYVLGMTAFARLDDRPGDTPTVVDFSAEAFLDRVATAADGYDPFPEFPEFNKEYDNDEDEDGNVFRRIGRFFTFVGEFFVWIWHVLSWVIDTILTCLRVAAAIIPIGGTTT